MRDPDLQYAYAQSTANSMMHLQDAMAELLEDPRYCQNPDLKKVFGVITRALNELIRRYKVDVAAIRRFNTRHVLRKRRTQKGKRRTQRRQSKKRAT